jgi:hypothetical protein
LRAVDFNAAEIALQFQMAHHHRHRHYTLDCIRLSLSLSPSRDIIGFTICLAFNFQLIPFHVELKQARPFLTHLLKVSETALFSLVFAGASTQEEEEEEDDN